MHEGIGDTLVSVGAGAGSQTGTKRNAPVIRNSVVWQVECRGCTIAKLHEMRVFYHLRCSAMPKFGLVGAEPGSETTPWRCLGQWKSVRLLAIVLVVLLCVFVNGCHSKTRDLKPSIEFIKVPAADLGGPDKTDTIEGRVNGARAGQQIVLFARGSDDLWWVQPFIDRPFTQIQANSRWKATIHLGTEYAALLVDPGYTPPDTARTLPSSATGVVVVAVVKGTGPAPPRMTPKIIRFGGYEWTARSAATFRGGSLNSFDPANAWTDENGALHLRIAKNQDKWTSAEVRLTRSLGYGTYAFTIRDVSHLEPSAVLTLFTWDDTGTEQKRNELDIEISRWGGHRNDNAQYVLQPYYIPTNVFRFTVPGGVVTYSFRWSPGDVSFSSSLGTSPAGTHVFSKHVFTSGVPPAGDDAVHMNLYVFGTGEIPLTKETEVIIEKFVYLP